MVVDGAHVDEVATIGAQAPMPSHSLRKAVTSAVPFIMAASESTDPRSPNGIVETGVRPESYQTSDQRAYVQSDLGVDQHLLTRGHVIGQQSGGGGHGALDQAQPDRAELVVARG